MQNFSIQFTNPWLLLLIIPVIAVALIPYFRVNKKYRRTRNRVISITLHSIIVVCCVLVISGLTFNYQVPNTNNEIILLVDVSQTQEQSADSREECIQSIINSGKYSNCKIGVVTFGFDQVYAVPLTDQIDQVYSLYQGSELPDTSATDIASAITYTKTLFSNPDSAKIVLISDGKETDEKATSVIKSLAAQGTIVDVVYIPSEYSQNEVQILSVQMPEYHVSKGENCTISFTLQSNVSTTIAVKLTDNDVADSIVQMDIATGIQTYSLQHVFTEEGVHEVGVELSATDDGLTQNNKCYSYFNLEIFKDILIVERAEGESDALKELLTENELYNVTVSNIFTDENFVSSIQELCEYDQVILNNISNNDMPQGFADLLYSYVYDYGGGLFTVGGNDETGSANAYNREDLYGTTLQSMLPVEAINYTPPVAVVIIIDRSGSMGGSFGDGYSRLDWARQGAYAVLDSLTERDYIGIMTLDSNYSTILPITERTKDREIRQAIASINVANGSTVYPGAINRAGEALRAVTNVARRHIILVTDGEVPDNQRDEYMEYIKNYYENDGITLSVVGISMKSGSTAALKMQEASDAGHGRFILATTSDNIIRDMREELNVSEIKEVNYQTFQPKVYSADSTLSTSLTSNIELQDGMLPATLDGFYGTKVKDSKYLVLTGDYNVPIYAEWKFGNGMVGSFMCDLTGAEGSWSASFMSSEGGRQFVLNAVSSLLPLQNIRKDDFTIELKEDNYINQLSVYGDLEDGETIQAALYSADGEKILGLDTVTAEALANGQTNSNYYVNTLLSDANNYSRTTFVLKQGGVYTIVVNKVDENGNVLATAQVTKEFSYSKEYNTDYDLTEEEIIEKIYSIAELGNGKVILDTAYVDEIYDSFVIILDKTYDPTLILVIIAMVLFLLDIAVRKFKFKWIHELVRESKAKKAEELSKSRTDVK